MRALLLPVGSHGDVLPMLGLGRALRQRGWQVKALVSPVFEEAAGAAGLPIRPLGTREDYDRAQHDPDLHSLKRGLKAVGRVLEQYTQQSYDELIQEIDSSSEPTLLIGTTLSFPIRLAQEVRGLPTVSVHLSPAVFRSTIRPPVLSPLGPLPGWLPRWLLSAFWWLSDRLLIDRFLGAPLNRVRARIGLKPVRGVMDTWMNQVDLSLGFFPEWFFPPPPDWPANLQLTGFPLWDLDSNQALPAELEGWLDQGEPPLIFTGGTAFATMKPFYEACVQAASLLGRRALVLTRHTSNLPDSLPEYVRRVEYAPFSQLLPRAAAIVHHGGIGTVAQALSAGVPQLVVPRAHDQFDNAHRVEILEAGLWCRSAWPERIAEGLGELLNNPHYRHLNFPVSSGLELAAQKITALANSRPNSESDARR